jgi:hypothetical protein
VNSMTVVSVLDREPTDQEAKAIAFDLLHDKSGATYEWFCSDELPPRELTGILLHDQDQLEAEKRGAGPGSKYFVVLVED